MTENARITYTWILLCALTILSWVLATTAGNGRLTPSAPLTLGVLAIGAVKARLILQQFMEVRTAPLWLRHATDGWLIALWATVAVMYLY